MKSHKTAGTIEEQKKREALTRKKRREQINQWKNDKFEQVNKDTHWLKLNVVPESKIRFYQML